MGNIAIRTTAVRTGESFFERFFDRLAALLEYPDLVCDSAVRQPPHGIDGEPLCRRRETPERPSLPGTRFAVHFIGCETMPGAVACTTRPTSRCGRQVRAREQTSTSPLMQEEQAYRRPARYRRPGPCPARRWSLRGSRSCSFRWHCCPSGNRSVPLSNFRAIVFVSLPAATAYSSSSSSASGPIASFVLSSSFNSACACGPVRTSSLRCTRKPVLSSRSSVPSFPVTFCLMSTAVPTSCSAAPSSGAAGMPPTAGSVQTQRQAGRNRPGEAKHN